MTTTELTPVVDPDLVEAIDTIVTHPTLADLIREGSTDTIQANGWGDGIQFACALKAAEKAAERRGII